LINTVVSEKKFKFAHFSVAALSNNKVFALDKQGYLIVANQSLSKHKVYKISEVTPLLATTSFTLTMKSLSLTN